MKGKRGNYMSDYETNKNDPIPPIIQKESRNPDSNTKTIKEIVEREATNNKPMSKNK